MAAADDRSISQFGSATALEAGSLVFVSEEDENSASGYTSKKMSGGVLGKGVLSDLEFPLIFTKTTAKSAAGAINEIAGTVVSGTLTAGSTSITLSDASITSTSMIDIYNSLGVGWDTISATTGSVTITFEAQSVDMTVKAVIK
ncbi:MAG: hypothetical protein IKY16_02495 [Bacteroidales bacterium]|nr:hypothetical protein [Bacteroidales bacterium]